MKHLLLITSLLCLTLFAQSAVKKGSVSADKLTIRAKAGTSFENMGTLTKGQEVQVVSEKGEWLEIRLPEGTKAWISGDDIDEKGTVQKTGSELYCGPAIVYSSICKVKAGDKLTLTGVKSGSWRGVLTPPTATAWVNKAFVVIPEDLTDPEKEVPAEKVAAAPVQEQKEIKPTIINLVIPDKTKELSEQNAQANEKLRLEQQKNKETEAKLQQAQAKQTELEGKLQEAQKKADEAEAKIKTIEAQWAAAENAQKEAVEAPKPAAEPTQPIVQLPTFTGYVMPLPRGNHLASHVLYTMNGKKKRFICYLNSKLQLNDWNGTRVKVTGTLTRPQGWNYDVLTVRSIMCD